MKLFKYTALALSLAVGFTACSDEEDYVPGAASDGVYFPTNDALEVTLDRNETSFEVIVSRLGETQAATYALTGSADDEVFTLPMSVSFAEGETSTAVHVGYSMDNVVYDHAYKVNLAFAPDTEVSAYGYKELSMTVTMPAPWTTIGKGTYCDLFVLPFYGITPAADPAFVNQWPCELQRNDIDPNRYRWVHPYGENFAKYCATAGIEELDPSQYDSKNEYYVEFVTDGKGNAVVPYEQLSGATLNESEGMVIVGTLGGYYYSAGNSLADIVSVKPETVSYFDATPGKEKFTTPAGSVAGGFTNDPEGPYLPTYNPGGAMWWSENVVISDFALSAKYMGVLTTPEEDSFVLADITVGADLAKVKAGLVLTEDEEAALEAVRNDEVPVVELTKSVAAQRFEFSGSGDYIIAVLGFDAEGNEVATAAVAVFVADTTAPKEWTKLGTGIMVDGWICPSFSVGGTRVDPMNYAYQVDMEENIENPGIYRIIAPWTTPKYPGASLNNYEGDPVNILVDARNPNFVSIDVQFSGYYSVYSDGSTAAFWVTTLADYYKAKGNSEESITAKELNNVMEEGEIYITFPTFGQTDKVDDPAPAIDDCTYTFYGKTPYSDELEACPGIFVLPSAAQNAKAKMAMRNIETKTLAKTRSAISNIASRYNKEMSSGAKNFKRSAKLAKVSF
ncbi:MAG: hypothetical protein JFR38_04140 [Muribaculaceae bacterium]|nr:hypothetical protein [Muribaculaceae bacterium]